MSRLGQTSLGAAAGLLIDRVVGEPPASAHPIAEFGKAMKHIEQALWANRRLAGIAYATIGVTIGAAGGWLMKSTATAVAVTAAGHELRQVAMQIREMVVSRDLPAARTELRTLVGRDRSELDACNITAAVIESMAENGVDAVIAPAFWGAVAGAPGAAIYRAINTMDAMVGLRNERYSNFGWAAARLDDVANYIPARIFATLVAMLNQQQGHQIIDTIRQDASSHPSPNAGVSEAAVAGALNLKLGGPLSYQGVIEERPFLGSGSRPEPNDIEAAVRLIDRVEIAAVGVLVLIWFIDWLLNQGSS
ncbi:MAG: cobalamin biosynthesis protein CobD [Acidimicrobiia bacterium]|nr:cobalamin biosynthesis protein CobD [Acidimicrobiia bacterium]